uniref:Uncharacterized protein n=1 Tax=Rhizophora mucronata TaxID=61149 RepID=A0A2P2JD94_RHIMU
MMMAKDKWVRAAMRDDSMVVQLLVRLKQAQATPPALIPLRWGIRLPRSRTTTAASARCAVDSRKKDGESSTRCSPTTPLSWSSSGGAASPSLIVDDFEEISRRDNYSPSSFRSKVTATTKRSRRKKVNLISKTLLPAC